MTITDIEVQELTIPDEVIPCWVYDKYPSGFCAGFIAEWAVVTEQGFGEVLLCDDCTNRWDSFGNVYSARRI